MSRFQCIADRCEATCCSGLLVPVTQQEWGRIEQAVAKDTGEVLRPASNQEPGKSTPSLFIPEGPQGGCVFLDDKKMCGLQKRHGEAVLPNICVTFPRVTLRWQEGLDMAGSLACPEVARLALLAEDAMEVESIGEERVWRPEAAFQATAGDAEDGWGFHAHAVRAAALRLLRRPESLAGRLHLLVQLGLRLQPFYFQNTEAFRGEGRAAAEARLTEVLAAAEAPEALEAARRELSPQPIPGPFFARLYGTQLLARLEHPVARCRTFVRAVVESYGGLEAGPEETWALYEARRERLERLHGARVRQYFDHHALNHWMQAPFLNTPSVLVDAFHLALSGGLLRWALAGHPEVVRLCEEGSGLSAEEARARLDAAAVETFQVLTRHLVRDPSFMAYAVAFTGQGEEQARELLCSALLAWRDTAAPAV